MHWHVAMDCSTRDPHLGHGDHLDALRLRCRGVRSRRLQQRLGVGGRRAQLARLRVAFARRQQRQLVLL